MSFAFIVAGFLGTTLALYCQEHPKDEKPRSPTDFLKPFNADSLVQLKPPIPFSYRFPEHGSGLTRLTFESFGQSRRVEQARSELSSPVTMGTDLHGLECPVCAIGMSTRSRNTLQPFGAKLTLNLLHGRIQLFSSFEGTESFRPEGFLQGIGRQKLGGSRLSSALGGISSMKLSSPEASVQWGGAHLLTNDQYSDQWLLQSHFGARAFLDREHNVSVGITRGYLYNNLSPIGMNSWTSTTADLTIRFNSDPFKAVARILGRARKKACPVSALTHSSIGEHRCHLDKLPA